MAFTEKSIEDQRNGRSASFRQKEDEIKDPEVRKIAKRTRAKIQNIKSPGPKNDGGSGTKQSNERENRPRGGTIGKGPTGGTNRGRKNWLTFSDEKSDGATFEENKDLFFKLPPIVKITNLYASAIAEFVTTKGGSVKTKTFDTSINPDIRGGRKIDIKDQYVVVTSTIKESVISKVLGVARDFAKKTIVKSNFKPPAGTSKQEAANLYLDYIESGIQKHSRRPKKIGPDGWVNHTYIANFTSFEEKNRRGRDRDRDRPDRSPGPDSDPGVPEGPETGENPDPGGGTTSIGGQPTQNFTITRTSDTSEDSEEEKAPNNALLSWAILASSVVVLWQFIE